MEFLPVLFDVLLALTLVFLAVTLLFTRDLVAAAIHFVAFGLAMALTWARLAAPDVALAEAAVGAGLTGAMVLRASRQMTSGARSVSIRWAPTALVLGLAAGLCVSLWNSLSSFAWPRPGLAEAVSGQMAELGLEQPVTSVILVFRGYDTWLELSVLLVTVLALLGTRPATQIAVRRISPATDPLLTALARLMLPLAVLVGGYLLWRGATAPGGAFQGGALTAAVLVLGYLAGLRIFTVLRGLWIRLLLILAFALPVLLALPALWTGRPMFAYPEPNLSGPMLALEIAIGISTAITLAALLTAAEPPESEPDDDEGSNGSDADGTAAGRQATGEPDLSTAGGPAGRHAPAEAKG